jgi:hypothetical protein
METARISLPWAFRETGNSLNLKGRLLVALNLFVALDDGLSRLVGVGGGRASGWRRAAAAGKAGSVTVVCRLCCTAVRGNALQIRILSLGSNFPSQNVQIAVSP